MSVATLPNSFHHEPLPKYKVMVLLVGEQAAIGEAVRRQLSDRPDMDFHYCSTGTEAIQLASEMGPTVILQDLMMPGVDGLTLVHQFRQTPKTKDTPIIVLTTRKDPEVKSQIFSAGANDYLVKLPSKAELIAHIYMALQRRDAAI